MSISAVIRTKNSGQTLSFCLESIQKQSLPVREIIIVDSGSSDNTLAIAEQFGCQIIHYPSDTEFNYSRSLNIGIEQATGECVLILSSHVVLKYQNTIELMLAIWHNWHTACAVSLCRDAAQKVTKTPKLEDVRWNLINRYNFQGQGMYNFCSLIRKSDWEAYPFNEAMPRCEDQDWVQHFYQQQNTGSLIIRYPTVYYNNPYYNATKDAWDYITLGHYIDRYFISKKFVYEILGDALKELRARQFRKTIYNLTVAAYIVRDRLQGTQDIRSVYNSSLENKKRASTLLEHQRIEQTVEQTPL
jgi:glycosyltransferase involved in cell wall biosynthesis